MHKLFPIYEVGSLPKLTARVKAIKGQQISSNDLNEIKKLSKDYSVDSSKAVGILEKFMDEKKSLSQTEKSELIDFNALVYLKMQESIGLDFVYDGEARRAEMYRHVAGKVEGFEDLPEMIRSRGPDSWRMAVCIGQPKLKDNSLDALVGKEFNFVKKHAKKAIKVPIDDPYMIAVMSDNRYFTEKLRKKFLKNPQKLRYEAKREFTIALAKYIIRPQVEEVVKSGAEWIQLDIPAATLDVEHIPIMVEGVNEVANKIENVKFSLHICYPRRVSLTDKVGYELLFPHILNLHKSINHLSLELANADQYEQDLKVFSKYQKDRKFEIGLGVMDITLEKQHKGIMESPEKIRQRIARSAVALKDPDLIYIAPDCGLRQLNLSRSIGIYETMVKGAELARQG